MPPGQSLILSNVLRQHTELQIGSVPAAMAVRLLMLYVAHALMQSFRLATGFPITLSLPFALRNEIEHALRNCIVVLPKVVL